MFKFDNFLKLIGKKTQQNKKKINDVLYGCNLNIYIYVFSLSFGFMLPDVEYRSIWRYLKRILKNFSYSIMIDHNHIRYAICCMFL